MAQYVCRRSAGAYVESDGRARSPVWPEGRRAVWSPLMIKLQHTDCQLMAGRLRAADPGRQPRSLLLHV